MEESGPTNNRLYVMKCIVNPKVMPTQLASDQSATVTKAIDPEDQVLDDTVTYTNNEPKDDASGTNTHETFGEGNSKKLAKKNAAIQMLKLLDEKYPSTVILPTAAAASASQSTPSTINPAVNTTISTELPQVQTKPSNTNIETGLPTLHPVTRLTQYLQRVGESPPMFTIIVEQHVDSETAHVEEASESRALPEIVAESSAEADEEASAATKKPIVHRECVCEVSVSMTKDKQALKCEGRASTKKLAKKIAAELMLVKLGLLPQSSTQDQEQSKLSSRQSDKSSAEQEEHKDNGKEKDDERLTSQSPEMPATVQSTTTTSTSSSASSSSSSTSRSVQQYNSNEENDVPPAQTLATTDVDDERNAADEDENTTNDKLEKRVQFVEVNSEFVATVAASAHVETSTSSSSSSSSFGICILSYSL